MFPITKIYPLVLSLRSNVSAVRINPLIALKKYMLLSLFSILLLCFDHSQTLGQAELLKDLNQTFRHNFNSNHSLINGGGRMYYLDQTSLWVSNGTTATTSKLKTFGA